MRCWLLAAVVAVAVSVAPVGHAQPQPACPPQATAPSAEQQAALAADAQDRGFLWRASKDGRASYLYGTVHLGRSAWAPPGPRVAAALQASDVLALEIDTEDPAMLQRLRAGMAAQRGAGGFALPGDIDARLRRQLAAACLPAALLDVMSPEMAATTLVVLSARADGLDPAWAIDPALGRAARALGKPVLSLETPELQLALLRSANADAASENVTQMLDALDRGEAQPMLLRVTRVWADSRHDELARYLEWCDCSRNDRERAVMSAVLDARNPALADAIDSLHRSGRSVFAAVGSLHMIGATGLPTLLAARGYAVEKIEFGR